VTTSNHDRSPLARLALAAGSVAALIVLAEVMKLIAGTIGGARGTLAAVLLAGAVFSGCGLVHSLRSRRVPGLTRPAPVRLPERPEATEPAKSAA
jgi:hypothetical protein